MSRIRVGVIGCGYWGPNLVRTFLEIPDATVVAVADRDPTRLEFVQIRHPHIQHFLTDHTQMFDLGLDAVVVSTPPESHHAIARECLKQGLDVLVEKPLATDSRDALELIELAEANDQILLVGHIGVYNPAVRALKGMIDAGELGEIRYVDAVRAGLGVFHPSLNVVWDLAPHDVSILLHLIGGKLESVSSRGVGCVRGDVEDVAYLTMMFEDGILAHSRLSWLDPFKTRRITVIGSEKMVVYDDLEAHEKLKVYDKRVSAIRRTDTFGEFQFTYHYGSVVSPYIPFEEPLRVEALHFLDCVRDRAQPLTDGRNGLRVVQVIEAAQDSLRESGSPVSIANGPPYHPGPHPVAVGSDGSSPVTDVLLNIAQDGNGQKGDAVLTSDMPHPTRAAPGSPRPDGGPMRRAR
jgi:predicted dehydrogenase